MTEMAENRVPNIYRRVVEVRQFNASHKNLQPLLPSYSDNNI